MPVIFTQRRHGWARSRKAESETTSMKTPTEEQLRDPAWWGGSAPQSATHYCHPLNRFVKQLGGVWKAYFREYATPWRTASIAPTSIELTPRPTKPEPNTQKTSGYGQYTCGCVLEIESHDLPKRCSQRHKGGKLWFSRTIGAKPKPEEWDGEGLPPVGCECRMTLGFAEYDRIKITYMGDGVFCYLNMRAEMEYTGSIRDATFHPIRTQAEREREELVKAVGLHLAGTQEEIADALIAAGWRKGES